MGKLAGVSAGEGGSFPGALWEGVFVSYCGIHLHDYNLPCHMATGPKVSHCRHLCVRHLTQGLTIPKCLHMGEGGVRASYCFSIS